MSSDDPAYEPALPVGASPKPSLWRLYQPLIWLAALSSAFAWSGSFNDIDWQIVAGLVVLGNLADLFAVRIQQGMRVSTTHFVVPFAIVASGVSGALIVAVGCLLGRLIFNRRDWNTFDVAVNVTAGSVAGIVWTALRLLEVHNNVVGDVLVVSIFAFSRSIINYGWATEARSKGIRIPAISGHIGKLMLACAALFTPAVSLYNAQQGNPLSAVALLLLPFIATQFMVKSFGRERDLNDSLEEANISLTESLVNALDARDPYSAGHSVAVAVYSRDIAAEVGLDPYKVHRIYLAGLLHDIGKIAVPDAILRKPAALTDDEFEEIKKHPVVGEQILAPSKHFEDILPAVRHHHERIDGKGYPDNLKDEEIPLDARIIAVADAYNAMTSERPYRDAMHPELACKILTQNQGMQHDPFLVAAFKRVLAVRNHDYAIAVGPDFATAQAMKDLIDPQNGDRKLRAA